MEEAGLDIQKPPDLNWLSWRDQPGDGEVGIGESNMNEWECSRACGAVCLGT